ncbi:glycoside hydrolase family protein [Cohnella cholangitidis]|uniref:Uncharacterized protein n=1 Tax=Cohnella cholangitidis TaxID=2598458 RepID=A0A7G5C0C1_9BACL|nr:hypothetical protein [Cohnella cholangitidis]QMV42655.1 hypothetical protein FPL14_16770 [Cohnella cholangitidis]
MSKSKLSLALILTVLLAVIPLTSVSAAVVWNQDTLSKAYDPEGNRYAYAPSVIREGDVEHMWTCHNDADGVIKDHIYYTRIENGTVTETKSVLQAGAEGSWDSMHVCDPNVVAGKFNYGGTEYDYALFYLGNDVDGSSHNQIGVAFSDDLSGDWVKYPNPVVAYPNDGFWGVGQPSATSIDGQGRIMLFFTKGDPSATAGYRIDMNLNQMANPVIGPAVQLTNAGLVNANGQPDFLNNFDIAYDPSRDRFIAIRELHPYPAGTPNYITDSQQIVSIDGGSVWGGGGQWKIEGTLSPSTTGFARNHNGGLLRTAHGTLPNPSLVEAYFTDSDAAPNLTGRAEYTYDVWRITGQLTDGDVVLQQELPGFKGKHFSVAMMTENLNTGEFLLHGAIDEKGLKKGKDQPIWIGYRIFDSNGDLVEAGTAYRDRIAQDGSFSIPMIKPSGQSAKLEVYLLSSKGKTIDSAEKKVAFNLT